jgi:hypothetical protein
MPETELALRSIIDQIVGGNAPTITWIVALFTAVARLTWGAATAALKLVQRWWDRPMRWVPIRLQLSGPIPHIKRHRCLVVRHASEDYVPVLVSESERWEARLLNKSIRIFRWPFNKREHFRGFALLPVHRRLGTQFKCYFDFRTEADANAFRALTGVPAEEQVKRGRGYFRVWLLLKDFETTKVRALNDRDRSFENNFVYPF